MLSTLCVWLTLCSQISGQATVIDSDTIVVEGIHIRLSGVDAEELNEPYGKQARDAMRTIIGHSLVTCSLTGDRSYSRYVGTCYTALPALLSQSIDIGAEIIRLGFALDCQHYSGGKYKPLEPQGIHAKLIQKPYC
jgi:micrococcal nuclease